MPTKVTFLQPEERQARLIAAALNTLNRPLTAGEQRWIEWYSWASDMEGFATVMTFLGAKRSPANEEVPNDADVDVLQAINDQIIYYATDWASRGKLLEEMFLLGRVIGAIGSWERVAIALGVPAEQVYSVLREYDDLIGC